VSRVPAVSADFPHVEGVTHRQVDADGLRVHVAEAGPGDAPPVLLLHGWPQHWYMWRHLIGALRGDFRLLAPDLRGFGWTDAPRHGYDGDTFAADQVALLDALGLERATVVGHDWGGWTAFLLGLDHSERVERMVVCNAPPPWVHASLRLVVEAWRSWYAVANALPAVGPRLARRTIPERILRSGHVHDPFDAAERELYLAQFAEPARAEAASRLYRYYLRIFREGLRGAFRGRRLTVPTRLLFGLGDLYVSPKLVQLATPNADRFEVELVADSGHFIVDEKPELVIAAIRADP
jgi:pimeloyl-ACP methyl ester carboxylesterase